jgi:large subunit ribosomal protein L30
MASKSENKIKVTQTRSLIGQKPMHRKTIKALGLKRIGHSREFENTPQIRGMINAVRHMVSWEEVK